jgi:hypothetical protein
VSTLILSPEEQEILHRLLRDAAGYEGLVKLIEARTLTAAHNTIFCETDQRGFNAGYAAAMWSLTETLRQYKRKVYNNP